MRDTKAARRSSSERILEMRYARAVHAVIAEHASERPDEHFRLPLGLQMQHVSESNVLGPEVGVLAGRDLALCRSLMSDHVRRAALWRMAQFAADVAGHCLFERHPGAFRQTAHFVKQMRAI